MTFVLAEGSHYLRCQHFIICFFLDIKAFRTFLSQLKHPALLSRLLLTDVGVIHFDLGG